MNTFPLIPTRFETSTFQPLEPDLLGSAANDSGVRRRPGHHVSDLNVLVAGVVGHVAGHVVPERVNVVLSLAQGQPMIEGDPTEVAFAISGVLTAELRAVEETDGGEVRVEVLTTTGCAKVVITAEEVPPLDLIRAVSRGQDPGRGGSIDPTVAHCRRLIEAHGGTIELTEHGGRIGFVLAFPTVMLSQPVRMLPTRERPSTQPPLRLAC